MRPRPAPPSAVALAFASLVIANSLLLTVFGQWEAEQAPRLP